MKLVPTSSYPIALDSDHTLFHVYNSTQSVLNLPLSEYAKEIEIIPESANAAEVWPDNGFVSIEDELIYYDKVEKNENGKVYKLKECIRGLEGNLNKYPKGTAVYGNVVAQHHNQLVNAVINIEEAIGDISEMINRQPAQSTEPPVTMGSTPVPNSTFQASSQHQFDFDAPLQRSMAGLLGCAPVGDDACPDVEFEFNFLSATEAEFCLRIFGNFTSFRIDFGDGNFTTTEFAGVHTYGGGGPFNPVATVTAPNCCILQQPTTPNEACDAPTLPITAVPFEVLIPEVPEFPQFVQQKQICPGPLLNLPPLIFPEINPCSFIPSIIIPSLVGDLVCAPSVFVNCPSLVPSIIVNCPSIVIPSLISCPSLSVSLDCPSIVIPPASVILLDKISIVGCDLPSLISVVGCCDLPNQISITGCCDFPSAISVVGNVGTEISVVGFPDQISVVGNLPDEISVVGCCDFPNQISVVGCCDFPSEILVTGFPSGIPLIAPDEISIVGCCDFPNQISVVGCCDFPSEISIVCPPLNACPTVTGTDFALNSAANFEGVPPAMNMAGQSYATANDDIPINIDEIIPEKITVEVPKFPNIKVEHDIPKELEVKAVEPIKFDTSNFPKKILVEPSMNFPTSIKVEGMPKEIFVKGMPSEISVVGFPEFIPMKYVGAPVDVRVHLDIEKALSEIIIKP